ncbi:MAG: hypothetical protein ACPH5N_01115 [Pseudomonadales bacterium]
MKMLTNKSTHLTGQFGQRRQQGNTLVPVVIGLVIAALATLAFLSQGQGLREDTQRVAAMNELIRHVGNAFAAGAGGNYALGETNIFGKPIGRNSNNGVQDITYDTGDADICGQLEGIIEKETAWVDAAATQCVADKNGDITVLSVRIN